MPRLDLLTAPTWEGTPLPSGRVGQLLAALAAAGPRGAQTDSLLDSLWETPPGNPENALQALVSRTRRACTPEVVVRTPRGYALGLAEHEVDVWHLADLARTASEALAAGDVSAAVSLADELGPDAPPAPPTPSPDSPARARTTAPDPLAALRADARETTERLALALATALSESGQHARALELLEPRRAALVATEDERALAAHLRSLAATTSIAAALARYDEIRAHLAGELGVDPGPRLQAVHAELLAADRPVRTGVVAPSTAILGREADLARIRELLAGARVVTLLGPGGIGKTTLADEVARTATQSVVHVVGLAAVTDDDAVPGAVARAIGVLESTTERLAQRPRHPQLLSALAQHLSGVPTLLVLDNCEQVLDGVATLVGALAASCPHLTVLTTSRRPLAIAAERVVPIPPLSVDVGAELFRARVAAVRPEAATPPEVVAQLVRRLDGLPLALELAAAQTRWMSVAEVAAALEAALDARFELLQTGARDVPDRHRTLLAVLAWSWDLMTEPERRALTWLAAFRAPFGRAGAAAVLQAGWAFLDAAAGPAGEISSPGAVGGSGETAGERLAPRAAPAPRRALTALRHAVPAPAPARLLASLVDHSLLTVEETPGGSRYRMLETIREFAMLQLASRGGAREYEAAWAGVRSWVVGLVEGLREDLRGPRELDALAVLEPEMPEVIEVLRDAVRSRDLATVLALASVLQGWMERGEHGTLDVVQAAGVLVAEAVEDGSLTPERGLVDVLCGGGDVPGAPAATGEATAALDAARTCLANAVVLDAFMRSHPAQREIDALKVLGAGTTPEVAATVNVALLPFASSGEPVRGALEKLALTGRLPDPDPEPDPDQPAPREGEQTAVEAATSSAAWMWLTLLRENEGDGDGAIEAARRAIALTAPGAPPSAGLVMRSMLAQLLMSAGEIDEGAAVAREALAEFGGRGGPAARELLMLLSVADFTNGDIESARRRIAVLGEERVGPGGLWALLLEAEIRLHLGEIEGGLAAYRANLAAAEAIVLPGPERGARVPGDGDAPAFVSPWVLATLSGCVTVHARVLGPGATEVVGELAPRLRTIARQALTSPRVDYPLTGTALVALAAWRVRVERCEDSVSAELLLLGERFGRPRLLGWGMTELLDDVERHQPDVVAEVRARLGDRRGPELRERAIELVRATAR